MTEHPQTIDNPRETALNGDQPNPRGAWFKATLGIVASPRASFEIIRRQSPWLPTLILMTLGTLVLGELLQPYQQQATRAQLAQALPGGAEQADALMAQSVALTEQAGPILRLAGRALGSALFAGVLLIQALFVWLLAIVFQGRGRFVQVLSLMVHVNVIMHLRGWVVLLIASSRGLDAIQSAQDADPIPGLNLLLGGDNAALNVVWASVNPFTIWFLALLGLGAAAVLGLPQRRGYLLAGAYWAATTGIVAATTGLAASMMPG